MNTRLAPSRLCNSIAKLTFASLVVLLPVFAQAQSTSVRSQIAELSQRFSELEQNYNLLKLEISNLTAENNRLKQDIAQLKQSGNSQEVEEVLNAKIEAHRKSTENYVKNQFERIMELLPGEKANTQPPQVIQSQQPTIAPSTTPTTTQSTQFSFSNDFPKDGEIYVVKTGDTLSKIAKQFGSSVRYIQNANKISDPNSVQVGQKLFVPIDRK